MGSRALFQFRYSALETGGIPSLSMSKFQHGDFKPFVSETELNSSGSFENLWSYSSAVPLSNWSADSRHPLLR